VGMSLGVGRVLYDSSAAGTDQVRGAIPLMLNEVPATFVNCTL
jgi:hypothetical protein